MADLIDQALFLGEQCLSLLQGEDLEGFQTVLRQREDVVAAIVSQRAAEGAVLALGDKARLQQALTQTDRLLAAAAAARGQVQEQILRVKRDSSAIRSYSPRQTGPASRFLDITKA